MRTQPMLDGAPRLGAVVSLVLLAPLVLFWGCGGEGRGTASAERSAAAARALAGPDLERFGEYWYQGKAELTSYDLEQARYGEVHLGVAVLIFVTEDFSESKHVKLDRPAAAGEDKVNVLKLNLTKKFNTGIYPYSVMTSVFTPVRRREHPRTLKVTTSVQEWCGHVFSTLNRAGDGYRLAAYSYFESDGDQRLDLPDVHLEDEVWTTIRLNPEDLPTGEVRMLPGTVSQRLRHAPWEARTAQATLEAAADRPERMVYRLAYPEDGRTLEIEFAKAFPHEIEAWRETYRSGFGTDARELTTRAVRKERLLLDYWTKNRPADVAYRAQLGLESSFE